MFINQISFGVKKKKCKKVTLHIFSFAFNINVEMEVKTRIIKVNLNLLERDKIRTIVKVLQNGGIIAYPTDTFYGLGVNCFIKNSILRIYRLKRREYSKPLSLVVSDMDMVEEVAVDISSFFRALASEFWPGPLTLVLKASSNLPKELQSSEGSIGVRLPAISWLRYLIREAAFPLTATSANVSGEREIFQPERIIKDFYGKVDLIVDGGKTSGTLPSTVIDLASGRPKILREGAVPLSVLRKYLE